MIRYYWFELLLIFILVFIIGGFVFVVVFSSGRECDKTVPPRWETRCTAGMFVNKVWIPGSCRQEMVCTYKEDK